MCGNLRAYILTEKESARVSSFHFIVGGLCAANLEMAALAQYFSEGGKVHLFFTTLVRHQCVIQVA